MFLDGGFEGICTAIVCNMQECALYCLILVATGLPCPFQGHAQFRVTVSTSSGFCKVRIYLYSNSCSYSFWGRMPLFLSEYITSLCFTLPLFSFKSFSLPVYFDTSWGMIFFGFVWLVWDFFECVCVFFYCFNYFCCLILWYFYFYFPSSFLCPFFSPHPVSCFMYLAFFPYIFPISLL